MERREVEAYTHNVGKFARRFREQRIPVLYEIGDGWWGSKRIERAMGDFSTRAMSSSLSLVVRETDAPVAILMINREVRKS